MPRTVGIGQQDFETIRRENCFYVDKTSFIQEWWEQKDSVTLITRPRRFGKTLTMSMVEKFFSVDYAGRADLFEGLNIWQKSEYRELQGTYPVIMISFADVKETSFDQTRKTICRIIRNIYNQYDFLLQGDLLNESEKQDFRNVSVDMEDYEASFSLKMLSSYLSRYYGKKVMILMDEYDTPMQEAYVNGYWEEMTSFIRSMFNATFKTNPYLECALMTGITRVSKESIFSDLNNLEIVTVTSEKYTDSFGFTEEEVFEALDEFGLLSQKEEVKSWYDGFTFGKTADIYNPWSILHYLDKKRVGAYWANSSSNALAGKLVQEGDKKLKQEFEKLLCGGSIHTVIDEQIVFHQLDQDEQAVWSLLLASGYLRVKSVETRTSAYGDWTQVYELCLTNLEVRIMFANMIRKWFGRAAYAYNDFIKALLDDDLKVMNVYMNKVALATFSYFDTGKNPSEQEPERFYHGFVLGLMVDLADRYALTSNRESGFGRYDVMLEPRDPKKEDGILIEFKVQDTDEEPELADTVRAALRQIEEKNYAAALIEKGLPRDRIRKYGFAFCGKTVLIGR
ncbi:MAG: AAA family ATPase [Lachnospiraceae bacterium]|nr:AAA family ATPase [Lachnospiraceae bacterium]